MHMLSRCFYGDGSASVGQGISLGWFGTKTAVDVVLDANR